MAAWSIVPYEVARASREPVAEVQAVSTTTTPERKPDIFFLVFDRYGSADAIQRRFGITGNDLYGWLADQGFQVPADSRASYRATDFSLASTLNMRYLDELTERIGRVSNDRTPAQQLLKHHDVGRFLKDQGYTYYNLGSWFSPTRTNAIADANLTLGVASEFESVLGETTIVPAVQRVLGLAPAEPTFLDRHREGTLFEFRQLHRLDDRARAQVRVRPHPPAARSVRVPRRRRASSPRPRPMPVTNATCTPATSPSRTRTSRRSSASCSRVRRRPVPS